MSYRHHPNPHWSTKLRIAELDKEFKVVDGQDYHVALPQEYMLMSQEDMRLFIYKDKLHGSFTLTQHQGKKSPTCVTGYGELKWSGNQWIVEKVFIPKYGRNDFSYYEKNWVPVPHGSRLYFIYQQHPQQVVIEVDGENVISELNAPVMPWAWGEIRGGTTPVDFKGVRLRFFHSCFHHTEERTSWRYHVGCCAVNPEPPFDMLAISSHPILSGHEWKNPSANHQKSGVAIAYGAVAEGESILLSVGINDACAAISRLTERQLRLI